VGAVAAGAHDVHGDAVDRHRDGMSGQGGDEAGDLVRGLALGPQQHGERRDLRRRGRVGDDLVHHLLGERRGQVLAAEQGAEHGRPEV
jgi:hypothetical protein